MLSLMKTIEINFIAQVVERLKDAEQGNTITTEDLKGSGTNISAPEVSDINKNGIWVLIEDKEYFISFSDYPVFKTMSVKDIFDFEYYQPSHLRWEKIDVDIELDALEYPEQFPLLFR
jgi:hypothetical protein